MKHPEREEWIPYIYGEATPENRKRLKAHLRGCSECQDQVDGWKQTLGQLDAWKLPKVEKPRVVYEPLFRWAFAAFAVLLVLGTGVAFGRFTAPKPSAIELRSAIEPEIRRQLRQEFAQVLREELARSATATLAASENQARDLLAQYASALQTQRLADNQAVAAVLDKMYFALKKDLDTVAVNTDASLRNAEQQLVQLASYTPSGRLPDSNKP